jgi:hypothetical protein
MCVVITEIFKVTELALIVLRQFLLKISHNEITMQWILFNTNWIACFEKGMVIIRYRQNDSFPSRSFRKKFICFIGITEIWIEVWHFISNHCLREQNVNI